MTDSQSNENPRDPGTPWSGPAAPGRSGARGRALLPWLLASVFLVFGFLLHETAAPIGGLDVETDFYLDLAEAARNLADGRFSVLDFPHKGPVYPAVLAAVHPLIGDWYRSGVLLNLLASALTLVVVWRILERLFGFQVAALSTLALAASPPFFVDGHKASSDPLFLLLAFGSVSLLIVGPSVLPGPAGDGPRGRAVSEDGTRAPAASPPVDRSRLLLAASGAMAGLATLTRYNGTFLLVGAVLVLLLVGSGRPLLRMRRAAFWILGFVTVFAPWVIINLLQTGRWLNTQNIINLVRGIRPAADAAGGTPPEIGSVPELISSDPLGIAGRYLLNLVRYFYNDLRYLVGPILGATAVAGLIRLIVRRPTRAQVAWLLMAGSYAAAMATVLYLFRLRTWLVPVYASVAFALLIRPDHSRIRQAGLVLALLALVPPVISSWRFESRYRHTRPVEYLQAAAFLRETYAVETVPESTGENGKVRLLALKPHLPFLAGMRYQGYPWEVHGYGHLLRHLESTGVRVVALGRLEAAAVPGLAEFVSVDSLPGLRPIYRSADLTLWDVPSDLEITGALLAWRSDSLETVATGLGQRAEMAMGNGDLEGAERFLRDAVHEATAMPEGPARTRILRGLIGNLALVWLETNAHEEAVELLRRELEREGLLSSGVAARPEAGQPAGTDAVPDLDPGGRGRLLLLLGLHEARRGEVQSAIRHLEEARRAFLEAGDETSAREAEEARRSLP